MAVRSRYFIIVTSLAVVFFLSNVAAQSNVSSKPAEASGSVIVGHVTAQGKPLENALITLWQGFSEPTPNTTVATGKTDNNGAYKLANVPSGNYFILATAVGFVTGKENNTIANIRRVTVVGTSAIDPINFELVPEGIIRGTVTDADGKPVALAPITVSPEPLPIGDPHYARDLRADAQGQYRIAGLPAGKYRIAAGYYPVGYATLFGRAGYARRFYDNVADEEHAKLIEISPGVEVARVDFNLGQPAKTFSVRARVVDSKTGKPVEDVGYHVNAFENGKRIGGMGVRGSSNARGEITIENVPPGQYSISVPEWLPGGDKRTEAPNIFGDSKQFEVTNHDVNDIEIPVVRAASITGFVSIEGAATSDVLAKIPQSRVVAMVMMSPMKNMPIRADGSFQFTGLRPGKVQFSFFGSPGSPPLPLRFVALERDGVRLDHDLELNSGDQITGVRLVLAYANSSVHGVVKLENGPLPSTTRGRASAWQSGKLVDSGDLDAHGEFVLQHLSAGEYKIAVVLRYLNGESSNLEKQIRIADDSVAEVTMVVGSTASENKSEPPRPRQ